VIITKLTYSSLFGGTHARIRAWLGGAAEPAAYLDLLQGRTDAREDVMLDIRG
jgi:hypothetical protein